MAKIKDQINDLFEMKKKESEQKAKDADEQNLDQTVYDIVQDPNERGRSFLSVRIKYNLQTGEAKVLEVKPFDNKPAGLAIIMDKESRAYLFEKK